MPSQPRFHMWTMRPRGHVANSDDIILAQPNLPNLIRQRNSQLFRANLPSLTPAKFSSYTVSHNFWRLSNCHISTTYYTNKMIHGTVQVLTFNPILVMHTLQNAGYGPFSQIQSYNILELDFYMFKFWQPAFLFIVLENWLATEYCKQEITTCERKFSVNNKTPVLDFLFCQCVWLTF